MREEASLRLSPLFPVEEERPICALLLRSPREKEEKDRM